MLNNVNVLKCHITVSFKMAKMVNFAHILM